VVYHRNKIFLPKLESYFSRIRWYNRDSLPEFGPFLAGKEVILWFHDETIFYAHDRGRRFWYLKDESAKPYKKGEGHSFMIADFVSAKFGFLQGKDGICSARRVMFPGVNKDGYFNNEDILAQARDAMDILSTDYPEYEHILIYDNATTHSKRAEDALSARHMPKKTQHWGIEVTERDSNGKIVYDTNRKPRKVKIRMGDAVFNGQRQSLYYEDGPEAGKFKGMAQILIERGLIKDKAAARKVRFECEGFKCSPAASNCCCRRMLFNQPDFATVPSLLETECSLRGFQVLFLPKFHPELNFIEQCWGYAKRLYRLNPESSQLEVLEKNALAALDGIPLVCMRRYIKNTPFCHLTDAL
jgi:transposase